MVGSLFIGVFKRQGKEFKVREEKKTSEWLNWSVYQYQLNSLQQRSVSWGTLPGFLLVEWPAMVYTQLSLKGMPL